MVARSLSMREVAASMPASSILCIIYIQRRISYDHTTKVEPEIKVHDANCRWSGVCTCLDPTAALRVLDLARHAPTFHPNGRWFERI